MPLFSLNFRDKIRSKLGSSSQNAVVDELDNLTAQVSAWGLVQHAEDGTHTFTGTGLGLVPIGSRVKWSLTTAPTGWLICNGAATSRTAFPLLFKTIGITHGAGDGVNTFNIPNDAGFIILAL